jgi:hypothetical protein
VITSEPDVRGNASAQQLSTTYNALRSCWRSAAFLCNGMSILLPYHLLANSLTRRRSSLFLLMYLLGMSITLPYHLRADSFTRRCRSLFLRLCLLGMSITLPYHVRADNLSRLRSSLISILCLVCLLLFPIFSSLTVSLAAAGLSFCPCSGFTRIFVFVA